MAKKIEHKKLSSPMVYLWKMIIFLVISAFVVTILTQQLLKAFGSNPGLNGLIIGVGIIGILLTFRQVVRLFPEVGWVNSFKEGEPIHEVKHSPVLLAPMATLLGNKIGEMAITTTTQRSIMDSIGMRLDESREISRYLIGLMVFLGLLGTFWGLLQTVDSVGATIQSLNVGSGDTGVIFEDLKTGLEAPLAGMGTAFSSSLFGLTGSLILGFLDLQAGQAQNRFYNELEDWLATVTEIDFDDIDLSSEGNGAAGVVELKQAIERIVSQLQNSGGGDQQSAQVLANLAEGIQGLVQHVRNEQQMMREWAETQNEQQKNIEKLLRSLNDALSNPGG